MQILFLTQIIPYPPDAGPKVKTWNVLKYLIDRGYRITLASFFREEERAHFPVLRDICEEFIPVPIRRSRISDARYLLHSQLTGRPFLIERDDLKEMRSRLTGLKSTSSFNVVHADQLTMAQFALPFLEDENPPILIFDAHNAVWKIVERMQENAPVILKPILTLETNRVKQYEGSLLRQFQYTLAVTEIDKQALMEAAASPIREAINSARIHVIPIAVDTCQLPPVERQPGSMNIVTLGTLRYPPNADGIRWFIQDVFPLIREQMPQVTLTIIGKDPPKDFVRIASQSSSGISVAGYIPDLTPYLEKAAMMVVPVRAGGGMRVRILEAFSRAIPVITTTVGVEGIDVRVGEDILVEDNADAFASTVVRLIKDPNLQARLSENGRRLAEKRYDWQVVLKKLDTIYYEIERNKIEIDTEFVQT